ncbi:hypothetical protein GCM10017750_07880 [Streptomyces racemochromogenes]
MHIHTCCAPIDVGTGPQLAPKGHHMTLPAAFLQELRQGLTSRAKPVGTAGPLSGPPTKRHLQHLSANCFSRPFPRREGPQPRSDRPDTCWSASSDLSQGCHEVACRSVAGAGPGDKWVRLRCYGDRVTHCCTPLRVGVRSSPVGQARVSASLRVRAPYRRRCPSRGS